MRTGTAAATERSALPEAAASASPAPSSAASATGLAPRAASAPAATPGTLVPGETVLGRYELVRVLGRGGAGTVWQAIDRQLGRPVAIKRLPGDGGERALAEARAAARLGHPAIVGVYALGAAAGSVWLITELVEGDTLRRTIAEDTHTDSELLQIGIALCGALRHAHGRGIVHRDVTPRNVLVPAGAFRGRDEAHPCDPGIPPAKLADFGIARLAGRDRAGRPLRDDEPPAPGKIVGTLSYMSPERLEGGRGDEAGDLWAVAVVLHEALTGSHPAGPPDKASALVRTHAALPSLGRRRPDLPEELVTAIDRASAPAPEDRGSVQQLEDALVSALHARGVAVAPAIADPVRAAGLPEIAREPPPVADDVPPAPRPRVRTYAARPRPALLPLAPFAAAIGAAIGPLALALALTLAVVAALLAARAGTSDHQRRVLAGLVVLGGAAGAAGLLVPALVAAAGGPGGGPTAPVLACLGTIAIGALASAGRGPGPQVAGGGPGPSAAPRSIR
ncbi:serine/threonine-protein kinase [Patulibacter defluvii]|uniref:serine/threonine-protein kinase n=1 Tax=Patulibacter defluvii TaxID=3095358 RepID=UPI002A75D046|nr:serine/threonine-protein kinase [Patulibacter sp. DM4]